MTRLHTNWQFIRTGLGGIWEVWRKTVNPTHYEEAWSTVSLPHSCNACDGVDPDVKYYQGPAWYRRLIEPELLKNPYPGGRTLLHFEGTGQTTEVYAGLEKVCSHKGGYDEYRIDLTDAIASCLADPRWDGKVPLAVCCDNSRELNRIPSDLSDFALCNGIYRPLHLVHVPAVSIERIKLDPQLAQGGSVSIELELYNPSELNCPVRLECTLLGPEGEKIDTSQHESAAWTGLSSIAEFSIDKPALWSPQAPSLYSLEITLHLDDVSTTQTERFGFRHFEFVEHGPFKLNGERLLLRGTHRHEDHADRGPAMSPEQIEAEMRLMKSMGVNFIRLGHYQQSRQVLDLCDELGLLAWEEIPWCRGGLGDEDYRQQCRRMLRAMIEQHHNHPAVILWGLGNENDWEGDFEHFDPEEIRRFMSELHELSHALDPTRLTAIRRCDFCKDVVDVYSPSIWAGWYRGKFTDYKSASEAAVKDVPHMLHVEWGADNHAGRHSENPYNCLRDLSSDASADEREGDYLMEGGEVRASRDGDWSETYFCDLIDWHLKEQETMPWLTGAAQWPFKDFCTPLRPENPVPYVNQKGVVARDLTPKEGFFVFQSYWTKEPMLRIYGHDWPVRWGNADEPRLVRVYSNCEAVELFLNGQSCGLKQRNSEDFPCAGLRWDVAFTQGENNLKAVARGNDTEVEDTVTFQYETRQWGAPDHIDLTSQTFDDDLITVTGTLRDKNGIPCLDGAAAYTFQCAGDGELIDNQGTPWGSRKGQLANGRARITVRRTGSGPLLLVLKVTGLPSASIRLKSEILTPTNERTYP